MKTGIDRNYEQFFGNRNKRKRAREEDIDGSLDLCEILARAPRRPYKTIDHHDPADQRDPDPLHVFDEENLDDL